MASKRPKVASKATGVKRYYGLPRRIEVAIPIEVRPNIYGPAAGT